MQYKPEENSKKEKGPLFTSALGADRYRMSNSLGPRFWLVVMLIIFFVYLICTGGIK